MLLVLSMPYAAALALIVAVLDLIPHVGTTLGSALLVNSHSGQRGTLQRPRHVTSHPRSRDCSYPRNRVADRTSTTERRVLRVSKELPHFEKELRC